MKTLGAAWVGFVVLLGCFPGGAQESFVTNRLIWLSDWTRRIEPSQPLHATTASAALKELSRAFEFSWVVEAEQLIRLIEQRGRNWSSSPEGAALQLELEFRRAQLSARQCYVADARTNLTRLETVLRATRPELLPEWEDEFGMLAAREGDFAGAMEYHFRAASAYRSRSARRELGRTLNLLGIAQLSAGKGMDASRSFEEAIGLFQELQDERGLVISRMNNAMCLRGEGRLREAHADLTALFDSAQIKSYPDIEVGIRANLAIVLQTLGRFSEALEQAEVALTMNRQSGDCRSTARFQNLLGVLFQETGDFTRAERELQAALTLARETSDRMAELSARNNLGRLSLALNQPTKAAAIFQSLAEEQQRAGNRAAEADVQANLAAALFAMNDYPSGQAAIQRALSLREGLGDSRATAQLLISLGALEFSRGQATNALTALARGFEIARQSGALALQGIALNNQGRVLRALRKYAEAQQSYARALAFRAAAGDPIAEAITFNNLMALSEAERRLEAAVFYGKQAVMRFQAARSNVYWLNLEAQQSFRTFCQPAYRRLATILVELGRLPEAQQVLTMLKEEEYRDYLRGGEADGLNTAPAWSEAQAELKRRYDKISAEIVATSHRYEELQGRGMALNESEQKERDQLNADLGVAVDAFLVFLDEVHQQSVNSVEVRQRDLYNVQGMQSTLAELGAGTVLLHYVIGEGKLHVLLTTPKIQVARSAPIAGTELNQKVFAFLRVLRQPRKDPRPLGREFYELLIEPIAADLQQERARTLMVSLDGALRYLPLAALHDGKQYLAESYRLALFTEVAKDKIKDSPSKAWSVAGMGLTQRIEPFDPLPYVRDELTGIVRQAGRSSGVLPGVLLMDEDFKLPGVLEALNQKHPVVHIASHFVFQPASAGESYLLLGDRQRFTLHEMRTRRVSFRNVDLLALSACETAVSESRAGSGGEFEGFAAEAQRLGAKGVLATLWPVADRSTSQFMRYFYEQHQRGRGLTKTEALQRAQLALMSGRLKEGGDPALLTMRGARSEDAEPVAPDFVPEPGAPFAHPYYWAPFVLIGNWR